MPFTAERRTFKHVARTCTSEPSLEEAYTSALSDIHERYNTSIRENRFTVDGTVEMFTLALLRACDVSAQPAGEEGVSIDIHLAGNTGISIKSQFTQSRSAFRLINTLGDSGSEWQTATFFVVAGIGIGYADPDLLPDASYRLSDAVMLPWRPLQSLWEDNPQWIHPMNIPFKSPTVETGRSLVASYAIAHEVLTRLNSPLLEYMA